MILQHVDVFENPICNLQPNSCNPEKQNKEPTIKIGLPNCIYGLGVIFFGIYSTFSCHLFVYSAGPGDAVCGWNEWSNGTRSNRAMAVHTDR